MTAALMTASFIVGAMAFIVTPAMFAGTFFSDAFYATAERFSYGLESQAQALDEMGGYIEYRARVAQGFLVAQVVSLSKPTISISVVSANVDRAGSAGVFEPGAGETLQTAYDWHWRANVASLDIRTVRSMKVTMGSDVWSTSDMTAFPLVVYIDETQFNSSYGATFGVPAGAISFDLYGQISYPVFFGGTFEVVFTDGTVSSVLIPASSVRFPASVSISGATQQSLASAAEASPSPAIISAHVASPNGGETAVIGQSMNVVVNTSDINGISFKLADYRNVASLKDKKALAQRYSQSVSQVALFGGDTAHIFSAMRAQLAGNPKLIDLPVRFVGAVAVGQQLFRVEIPAAAAVGSRYKIQILRNGNVIDESDGVFFVVSAGAAPAALPPVIYTCADSIDNDADGRIDYPHDSDCASPSDPDEQGPIEPIVSPVLPGDTLTPDAVVEIFVQNGLISPEQADDALAELETRDLVR